MKNLFFCVALILSTTLFAQSKKELLAELAALKAENAKLKADVSELKNPKAPELTTSDEKACYGLGILMASSLKSQGGDSVNVQLLMNGVKDVYANSAKMQPQEASMFVQNYMQTAMERKTAKAKEEGVRFLEANRSKEGVAVTSTGLQYKVMTKGSGKAPTASSNVTVHYTGKLIDGTIFDSSVERGSPATFGVTQVIAGWTEALQLMHEGDKWMLFIPSELGYGERGAGGQIPPHSVLIFEVELIKVE